MTRIVSYIDLSARARALASAVSILAGGCGPALVSEEQETDDEFLAEAEELVDAMCTRLEACEERREQYYLVEIIGPFPDDSCYEPLLDSTERIYEGDRCTKPETLLVLYDCMSAQECPSVNGAHEDCADELEAVEAALCYPF